MNCSSTSTLIIVRRTLTLLAAAALSGCFYEPLPLDGLACSDAHPCAAGYTCNAGVCTSTGALECDPAQVGKSCSVGQGACTREGTLTCSGATVQCSAQPGTAVAESCDGVDNDCDGSADEDLTPPACGLTQGVCATARPTCGGEAGWSSCSYGPDYEAEETLCDGLDNDCDGEVDEVENCILTVAGDGPPGFRDGDAASARFALMRDMAEDTEGNLYVSDRENHAIRKITLDGAVTTLAGNGICGLQDGPAATSQLCYPWGVDVGADGTVYFSDAGNHRVRAIVDGVVTTVAGGAGGFADGAAVGEARFLEPAGIELQSNGDLLIADRRNHRIRRFVKATGDVETVAGGTEGLAEGSRSTVQLKLPVSVVSDSAGTLYVAEHVHRIRKLPVSGTSSTLAGQTNGTGGAASDAAGTAVKFNLPQQLLLDEGAGVLYVADTSNFRIRKVPLDPTQNTVTVVGSGSSSTGLRNGVGLEVRAGSVTGFVKQGSTFYFADGNGLVRKGTDAGSHASSPVEDFTGGVVGLTNEGVTADGPASSARLRRPQGLARDAAGTIYWVERESNTLRQLENGVVTTLVGPGGGHLDGSFATARLDNPRDVAIGPDGRLYLVESFNHTLRVVDLEAKTVSTLAGGPKTAGYVDHADPTQVRFNAPRALVFGTGASAGTLFVADDNCVIRAVDPDTGETSTFAGNKPDAGACTASDGDRANAQFKAPAAIATDGAGNLYVADLISSSSTKIRKVSPDGSVQTLYDVAAGVNGLAFDGTRLVATADQTVFTFTVSTPYIQNDYFKTSFPGWRDGPASSAGALEFYGVTAAGGDYYLTDEHNHRIRKLRKQP